MRFCDAVSDVTKNAEDSGVESRDENGTRDLVISRRCCLLIGYRLEAVEEAVQLKGD